MCDDQDELDYCDRERIAYEKFLQNDAFRLELGKTYLQESASWAKKHYHIVFQNDDVSLGVVVWCGIYQSNRQGCGGYQLFKTKTGEKYRDCRLAYRLTREVTLV